jgi:hypothetical protein
MGKQATPPPVAAKPASKPSDAIQAKILRLQLQFTRLQSQYQSCQQTNFQGQANQVSLEMNALADQALAEAKLDKKEWELNLDTLDFQKRAAPTAAEKK